MKKINFLDIPIDVLIMQETIQKAEVAIEKNQQIHYEKYIINIINKCPSI